LLLPYRLTIHRSPEPVITQGLVADVAASSTLHRSPSGVSTLKSSGSWSLARRSWSALRCARPRGFDDPVRLDAFLNAVRWGAIRMQRVNLLIADDAGQSKTVESDPVIQELMLPPVRSQRAGGGPSSPRCSPAPKKSATTDRWSRWWSGSCPSRCRLARTATSTGCTLAVAAQPGTLRQRTRQG
jgi:hypothetical protein